MSPIHPTSQSSDWGIDLAERRRMYAADFFCFLFLGVFGIVTNGLQLYAIVAFPAMRRSPNTCSLPTWPARACSISPPLDRASCLLRNGRIHASWLLYSIFPCLRLGDDRYECSHGKEAALLILST